MLSPTCLRNILKTKQWALLAENSGYRSCLQAACRQANFETEQPGDLKNHSPGVLELPPTVSWVKDYHQRWTLRERDFNRGNLKSSKRPRGQPPTLSRQQLHWLRSYSGNEWPHPLKSANISTESFTPYFLRQCSPKTTQPAKYFVKKIAQECVNHQTPACTLR
jgi:hypothetical protein